MKIIIEGLDRLGKDTLIEGILQERGYHHVAHYSKPKLLQYYLEEHEDRPADVSKRHALRAYQVATFRNMFQLLQGKASLICNRAHLGECVYAPLYRGYAGSYVFELEEEFEIAKADVRLILLTENFERSNHFVDDGLSLGKQSARSAEQKLFLEAFALSNIADKRIISVTDDDGAFRPKEQIVRLALE